ncbi:hypothetical protein LFAB_14365 [Lactiplantibacillus fabifermentans T30PCM01]|uniref:Probable membrane transporter protein n=1 Tax=Lactiplantibacillus fabifermentans T30PCM01 TaxID=1400520 RepID=W6T4P2_9LACO|nr:sulfite exporter TauE/SafE family protein [Lactiplantibacillus fabifermentans]ETY72981.1 hypothetical protein LFAB_14365 [Lactiplantibacillus fabifermentans T30PCM01]
MGKIGLYFIIIFFANTIGAVSGMGGGVIIKPLLDAFSGDRLATIGFYSSLAVFVMAIVSTAKNMSKPATKKLLDWTEVTCFAVGSLMGGSLGDFVFNAFRRWLLNEPLVNLIQIGVLVIILVISLIMSKPGKYEFGKIVRQLLFVVSGIFLGALSTFLGIGGGPINVALLIYVFSFSSKKAVLYSIVCIFFSQLMKLLVNLPFINGLGLSISIVVTIMIAAILGGYTGATITNKISDRQVLIFYKLVVIFVIGLNIFNGMKLIMWLT